LAGLFLARTPAVAAPAFGMVVANFQLSAVDPVVPVVASLRNDLIKKVQRCDAGTQ
jgi:hypothetical protein